MTTPQERTTWSAEQDTRNKGYWQIVNAKTRKVLAYGLSQVDADRYVKQHNSRNP